MIAGALTVAMVRCARDRRGLGLTSAERRIRLVLAVVLVAIALPWIASVLGFYLDGLPLLGPHIMGSEFLPADGEGLLAAVHLGHHHGLDGVLLGLSALALWPALRRMQRGPGRHASLLLVALMFVYGATNALQDLWLEQVVKRGSTSWTIPEVIRPEPTLAWLGIVIGTLVVWLAVKRALPVSSRACRS